MARIPSNTELHRILSHLGGVRRSVRGAANEIGRKATGNLAARRDTGAHSIETSHAAVDSYVELVGPAALSLEVGHHARNGEWVEGTRILRNASRGE